MQTLKAHNAYLLSPRFLLINMPNRALGLIFIRRSLIKNCYLIRGEQESVAQIRSYLPPLVLFDIRLTILS